MRHWYLALNQEELELVRALRFYTNEGVSVTEAAEDLGVPYQRAHILMSRAKTTAADLRERRKEYIVSRMADKRTAHRHTAHVIGCYFKVEESYIEQLMKELRAEGRLPSLTEKDREWQDDILKMLRRRFPMVVRAETVGKKKEQGDKVFISGRGWLSWPECRALATN